MNKLQITTKTPLAYEQMLADVNFIKSDCIIVDCAVTKKGKMVVCAFSNENEDTIFEVFENAQEMDERVHLSLFEMFKRIECEAVITDCSIGYLPRVMALFKAKKIKQIFPKPLKRTIKIKDESQIVRLDKVERKVIALTSAF